MLIGVQTLLREGPTERLLSISVFAVHMEKAYSKPRSIILHAGIWLCPPVVDHFGLARAGLRYKSHTRCETWQRCGPRLMRWNASHCRKPNSCAAPSDKGLNPAWLGDWDLKCKNGLEGKPPTQVCLRAIMPRCNHCLRALLEFAPCCCRERGLLLFTREPLVLVVWPRNPLVSHV